MKRWTVVVLVILVLVSVVGCLPARGNPANVETTKTVKPIDYGSGVYYFPVIGAGFGNSLSDFIKTHSELKLVSMAADDASSYGHTVGYFVVFSGE